MIKSEAIKSEVNRLEGRYLALLDVASDMTKRLLEDVRTPYPDIEAEPEEFYERWGAMEALRAERDRIMKLADECGRKARSLAAMSDPAYQDGGDH